MLISKSKFKMSGIECTKRFMEFAHFYQLWFQSAERKKFIEGGNKSFLTAEYENPLEAAQNKYRKMTSTAISKLFALDKEFYTKTGEHIVARLETFSDYEKVLEDINQIAESAIAKED